MGCYRKLPRDGRTEFKRLQRKAEAQACYSKPEDQHKACYKDLSNGAKTQWDSIAWNHWPWTWLRGSNTPYIPRNVSRSHPRRSAPLLARRETSRNLALLARGETSRNLLTRRETTRNLAL